MKDIKLKIEDKVIRVLKDKPYLCSYRCQFLKNNICSYYNKHFKYAFDYDEYGVIPSEYRLPECLEATGTDPERG